MNSNIWEDRAIVTASTDASVLLDQISKKQLMAKVLVIEDEEILRETILNILKLNGFSAIEAVNGRQGLQLAKEWVPNLILCDIRMPELDGYEVLRALRQDPVTASIPVIFLTAESIQKVIDKGQSLGAKAYLSKPFSTAQLLEAINKELGDR
jgi:CheY-like chemotaxis protein